MALDEALLLHATRPTLRFYSWVEPAATFGYFQKYEEVAKATQLRPLIRRCTGGGIVPHDHDWTYSLVFPAGTAWFALKAEASYQRVHEWVCESFRRQEQPAKLADCCHASTPGSCFSGFEKHDVLLGDRKIAGAAQRRVRSGLLIQGSIQPPEDSGRSDWEREFTSEAEKRFAVGWEEVNEELFRASAQSLERDKYRRDDYNRRR